MASDAAAPDVSNRSEERGIAPGGLAVAVPTRDKVAVKRLASGDVLDVAALAELRSEGQASVLLDLFHNEEGSRLPDARERDQLLSMQLVEILHITDADFQEVVEVSRD